VGLVERHVEDSGIDEDLETAINNLINALKWIGNAPERKLREALARLRKGPQPIPLEAGEAWSDAALGDLTNMSAEQKANWIRLLIHCQGASGGSPSAKWVRSAEEILDDLDRREFKSYVLRWFPLVDKPRTQVVEARSEYQPNPNLMIIDPHADIIKGLAWCCGLEEDKEIARALTALALSAYKKVPGIGPRAVRVGNACVWSLGNMPGMEGVGQLAILKVRVKSGTAQKGIEKALEKTAERVGLPRQELEEMAVPAYGLTEVGLRRESIGEFTAELRVTGTNTTELRWIKPDGKPQKSVPAAVKNHFADDLKELKQAGKDIQKMLPAQRERIDQLLLQQKNWPLQTWRERYFDHPLVGTVARRLIWQFTNNGRPISGIFRDGQIVDVENRAIKRLDDENRVELWHPIGRDTDEIQAWRQFLEEHEIQQPFKQAHREVYLLTDAERTTGVYSNRYAAHILRQHQFSALCAARGWKNKLRLMVDDEYPPASLSLPRWGLRAEFWIEGIGDEYGTDTNESGVYHYLATDQVRFYAIDAARRGAHAYGGGYYTYGSEGSDDPIPLDRIPPLVFSEVMRDVDLFVGVASVGNDPNWSDGGPEGRYREYWQDYAFGELKESAQTRKQVLERIIPRLKIADRCSFADRFLIVKGKLRTYKIHLGSGNIRMEPNDEYLCIVPSRKPTNGKIYLPFEGDQTLSIILSKALMLAEDTKIKDSVITSQIRRRR
jgi:hypothetical protein